jgi:hypothetical protein
MVSFIVRTVCVLGLAGILMLPLLLLMQSGVLRVM